MGRRPAFVGRFSDRAASCTVPCHGPGRRPRAGPGQNNGPWAGPAGRGLHGQIIHPAHVAAKGCGRAECVAGNLAWAEKTTNQRQRQIRPKNGVSTFDLGLGPPRIWAYSIEYRPNRIQTIPAPAPAGWIVVGCGDSPPSPCASLPHRTRQETKGGRTESGGDRREGGRDEIDS